jgi:NAD(P)-dependent dehydrogenase (short-subunit alcohol dehydrogenase family)
LGPVDLLVNNAGVGGPIGPLWGVAPEEWWRTIEINLGGVFHCARAVLPVMRARRRGRIVNLVSAAGTYRWPNVGAYAISKTAVIKLSENLAAEVRKDGVAVFAIHPGIVRTELTETAMRAKAPADSPAGLVAAWFRQEVAAGRDLPPERAAELVVALARGQADVLSGRYIDAHDDLAALVARAEEIQRGDLYTLRLRLLPGRTG